MASQGEPSLRTLGFQCPSHASALTQDAHIVSAFLLVCLNEVVEGVREVLEQCILFVHFQPQDAVQELGDGTVWR